MSLLGALRWSRKTLFISQRALLGILLFGRIPLRVRGINRLVTNSTPRLDLTGAKRPIRAGRDIALAGAAA